MSDQERAETTQLECLVAAILTTVTVDRETHGVPFIVNRYVQTLQALRLAGGPVNPVEIENPSKARTPARD